MERCRFTTSWGGVERCAEPAYRLGLCRFHFDCYTHGEIEAAAANQFPWPRTGGRDALRVLNGRT